MLLERGKYIETFEEVQVMTGNPSSRDTENIVSDNLKKLPQKL